MKLFVRLLSFLVLLGFILAQANANPLYEIDMEKCPVFLAKLKENQNLERGSHIEDVFSSYAFKEPNKEEIIGSRIKSDVQFLKGEISKTKGQELSLVGKKTYVDIKEEFNKFMLNDAKFCEDERVRVLKAIDDSFAKHLEGYDKAKDEYRKLTYYPLFLWNSYVSNLLLGINVCKDFDGFIPEEGRQFGFELDSVTKSQVWNLMTETGFIKSKVEIGSFKYSAADCLSQAWRSGNYKSVLLGCGHFDRKYVERVREPLYSFNVPEGIFPGNCDIVHNHNILTVNLDPIEVPDVIADAFAPQTWVLLDDDSIPEIIDETNYEICLTKPDFLKASFNKLAPGGYLASKSYSNNQAEHLRKLDDLKRIGNEFGYKVEWPEFEQPGYYFYKLVK